MLLVVTAASGWLAWQAYRAEKQASAVAALGQMRGQVTSRVRNPEWFWTLFGRLGRTIVRAEVDSDQVQAAMPLLKALSDLEEVDVVIVGPGDHNRGAQAELILHAEMPRVRTQLMYPTIDWITVAETVHVPNGASILLGGGKRPRKMSNTFLFPRHVSLKKNHAARHGQHRPPAETLRPRLGRIRVPNRGKKEGAASVGGDE
jgi:hypothetical protein